MARIGTICRLALAIGLASPATLHAQAPSPAPSAAPVVVTKPLASLDAAAFARIPFIENATLSPDGTRIAGLLGVGGQQRISLMPLFDETQGSIHIGVPEGTEANWLRWVNDDNLIVGLQALLPLDGRRTYVSRLIAINRTSGKVTKLLWDSDGQNAADVLWIPSDGSTEILVAAQNSFYLDRGFYPTVYRVNVATGHRRTVVVEERGIYDWSADSNGSVRIGTGYEDNTRKFRLIYRGEGGQGGFRTIDKADSRKRESLLYPFQFLPGTDHALIMGDDDDGFAAVYEVDMTTQATVRTVFSAPKGTEVERAWLSADGKTVLGYGTSAADPVMHWIDPQIADVQAQIDKTVTNRKARIISFNRDRTRMLIRVDRADAPGALYFFDVTDGRLQRIAAFNDAIGGRTLSPVKLIRYKARDGLEIEAVLTLPKDRPATGLPIVVMPHGGPWGQDRLSYDYWAQFVAGRGYAVLQPNFRGSTGYGTDFVRKGEGQLGLAMQDDVTDALRWAVAEGIADPKRACIMGGSYGGYAAMWGVAKDPDQYRCAISIAGVASLRREVNDFGGSFMQGKYRDDWQRMTPDFAAVSPLNAVARIKAPLLLIHGKKDVTVESSHSDSMNSRMRAAGKAVELVMLPEADHYFTRQADRQVLLQSVEAFLAKHNPVN